MRFGDFLCVSVLLLCRRRWRSYQSTFATVNGTKVVRNLTEVSSVVFRLHPDFASGMYDSCAGVPIAGSSSWGKEFSVRACVRV